jgi:hypothetical protein
MPTDSSHPRINRLKLGGEPRERCVDLVAVEVLIEPSNELSLAAHPRTPPLTIITVATLHRARRRAQGPYPLPCVRIERWSTIPSAPVLLPGKSSAGSRRGRMTQGASFAASGLAGPLVGEGAGRRLNDRELLGGLTKLGVGMGRLGEVPVVGGVAVGGKAAGIFEHPGEVQHVPGHEHRVAQRPNVLLAAALGVEI